MNEIYAGYVTTAMRYAAPQMAKHGLPQDAFLGEVTAYLNGMTSPTEAYSGNAVGTARDGRMEDGLGHLSSPATVAVLVANEVGNARG
jgi:hypothetical protein